jgi:putative salt-induced outer membrane protein YdiY
VTAPLADVAGFTTDEPVAVKLNDGHVVTARVAASAMTVPTTGPAVATATAPAVTPIVMGDVASVGPATKSQPWHGEVTLGGLVTTGNTQTQQVNATAEAIKRWEEERLTLKGQYLFGRQKDRDTGTSNTTTDSWLASGKYDHFLSKKLYLYGLMRVEHDAIADLNLRVAPSVGVGYQWHESARWNFNTEAGLGWTFEDYDTGDSREYVNARLAYHYDRKLVDNVRFAHNLEYLPSLEDVGQFIVNADVGLRADLTKRMFTDFKIQWTYNSDPAPGAFENDVRYLASLGWRF